jgi:DNA-binding NtrC family response regulator
MTITRYPALVIIEDTELREEVAQVKMEDGGCATVTVSCATNAHEWAAISEQIRGALLDMRLEGDERDPA